jgi:hypothetical protein
MHGESANISGCLLQAMDRASQGMHAGHSKWANPGALKEQLQGVTGIKVPPM